jgi:hypothetical protein
VEVIGEAMSEKNAYATLKDKVFKPMDRVSRVENALETGMPDVNYCIKSVEGWIEIKYPTEPKRENTRLFGSSHKFSQDQLNWILEQRNAGGIVWLFIVTDKRYILVNSKWAEYINDMTLWQILVESSWAALKPNRNAKLWEELWKILANK